MIKLGIVVIIVGAVLVIAGLGQRGSRRPMTKEQCLEWIHTNGYPDGHSAMLSQAQRNPPRLTAECVQAAQNEIQEYAQKLIDSGRYTTPGGAYTEIAQHRWFLTTRAVAENHASNWSGNNGDPLDTQMGMYVFYQPLFDFAMRSWHTNVFMEKGSDIVRAPAVTFDKSIIGFQTFVVTDQDRDGDDLQTHQAKLDAERKAREAKGRTIQDETSDLTSGTITTALGAPSRSYVSPPKPQPSTVVEFLDAHTIRISRKARACVNGYSAMFVPPEWNIEMCNCTLR